MEKSQGLRAFFLLPFQVARFSTPASYGSPATSRATLSLRQPHTSTRTTGAPRVLVCSNSRLSVKNGTKPAIKPKTNSHKRAILGPKTQKNQRWSHLKKYEKSCVLTGADESICPATPWWIFAEGRASAAGILKSRGATVPVLRLKFPKFSGA